VFNAANEQAVALFLAGNIRFADIAASIDSALTHLGDLPSATREELLDADMKARRHVMESFGC
jgi:1-deoxy-D-xylulose 5-phosphate reductoisomerase